VLTYNHSLQPTILNDNVNQFNVGLESDKGYFTLKVKTMTLMFHFFARNSTQKNSFKKVVLWRTINLGRQISDISKKSMQATIYCHYD
jgi:hypothetical protein